MCSVYYIIVNLCKQRRLLLQFQMPSLGIIWKEYINTNLKNSEYCLLIACSTFPWKFQIKYCLSRTSSGRRRRVWPIHGNVLLHSSVQYGCVIRRDPFVVENDVDSSGYVGLNHYALQQCRLFHLKIFLSTLFLRVVLQVQSKPVLLNAFSLSRNGLLSLCPPNRLKLVWIF